MPKLVDNDLKKIILSEYSKMYLRYAYLDAESILKQVAGKYKVSRSFILGLIPAPYKLDIKPVLEVAEHEWIPVAPGKR